MADKRNVNQFVANTADGRLVVVNVFREMIDSTSLGGHTKWIEGLLTMETDDGTKINRIKQGEYELLTSEGEAIKLFSFDGP